MQHIADMTIIFLLNFLFTLSFIVQDNKLIYQQLADN